MMILTFKAEIRTLLCSLPQSLTLSFFARACFASAFLRMRFFASAFLSFTTKYVLNNTLDTLGTLYKLTFHYSFELLCTTL